MYAVNHGLDPALADQLTALTLSVVVASIVLHGISVTPLMAAYERHRARRMKGLPLTSYRGGRGMLTGVGAQPCLEYGRCPSHH